MAENSKIEWCNHTANIWWGCTKVHAGCQNCYALTFAKRVGNDIWGDDKPRRMIANVWKELAKYQKEAEQIGEVHRVFVGSMMDIFEKPKTLVNHKGTPINEDEAEFWNTGQLRDKFFNEVVPNSPNLMFLLLTKRPSNINKYIPDSWKENPPANVMFGTSPASQKTANDLISQLAKVKGKQFVSIEPQLELIDLTVNSKDTDVPLISSLDWIINGGESGHTKRPFDTDWARKLRDDCKAYSVPFFFKQIDKIQAIPEDLLIREFPKYHNKKNNLKQLKMKTTMKTVEAIAKNKEERISNSNNKCALALERGYKYDRATGKIIGRRNKAIKAHINGYTIISFVVDGKRKYLYGTTLIEYILKKENESISLEDIEFSKVYVKPSKEYLLKIKALKQEKKEKVLIDSTIQEIIIDESKATPIDKNLHIDRKHMKFSKLLKRNRSQKRVLA